jgi:hypothetical protein
MHSASSPTRFRFSDLEGMFDAARFGVFVLFTSVPEALLALRRAAGLATQLTGRIELIVPEIVPYPLPVDRPPVIIIGICPRMVANQKDPTRTLVGSSGTPESLLSMAWIRPSFKIIPFTSQVRAEHVRLLHCRDYGRLSIYLRALRASMAGETLRLV